MEHTSATDTQRRLQVLFVSRAWTESVGGVSTHAVELVGALRRYVDVWCLHPPSSCTGRLARTLYVVTALLRRNRLAPRFDLVHLGDSVLFPLCGLLRKDFPDTPFIMSAHGWDITHHESPTLKGWLLRRYWTGCDRFPIKAIVANSPFTANCAKERSKHTVVTVPLAGRQPCPPLEPPASRNHVLFVGRITPRKGVDWFVEHVLPKLPDLKLVIVGQSHLSVSRFRMLRSHPQVEFSPVASGPVPAEIRRRAFACIVPNRDSPIWDPEGFGIVAAEHAHTGRPTVATAVQGLTAAVAEGITGFLVPPDAEAWVKRLTEIRSWETRQYEEFSERCVAYAAEHFTWDRVARDTLRVYRRYVSVPEEINGAPLAIPYSIRRTADSRNR